MLELAAEADATAKALSCAVRADLVSLEEEDGGVEGELGLEPLVEASAIARCEGGVWAAWGFCQYVEGHSRNWNFFLEGRCSCLKFGISRRRSSLVEVEVWTRV